MQTTTISNTNAAAQQHRMISTQNAETSTDIKSVGAPVIVAQNKCAPAILHAPSTQKALMEGRALFLKNSIKKRRRELLAAPFSVSAYKLLLSLDLLLAEFEGGCR